mmetsp:Transcript_11181/g.18774  ORF Transcript_11181/g.18774 Transcript_11181/m.18774 type:complete len:83 (+) Transcript_11181:356-604(+)
MHPKLPAWILSIRVLSSYWFPFSIEIRMTHGILCMQVTAAILCRVLEYTVCAQTQYEQLWREGCEKQQPAALQSLYPTVFTR